MIGESNLLSSAFARMGVATRHASNAAETLIPTNFAIV